MATVEEVRVVAMVMAAAMVAVAMVEAATMAAARAAARAAAGLRAPVAGWPPGATAVGSARLRWVAPRWCLRRRAGVPQAAPAAGDLRWCLRRAVSGGGSCGERPLAGRSLRQASLRTVRRQVAPSAGGSGGAGGIAYLPRRLRQAGVERRGLALGAEVGRRLFWRLRA